MSFCVSDAQIFSTNLSYLIFFFLLPLGSEKTGQCSDQLVFRLHCILLSNTLTQTALYNAVVQGAQSSQSLYGLLKILRLSF